MSSLIEIISRAIAVVRGLLGSTTGLQAELNTARNTIAAQEETISNLKQQIEADQVDDAALEAAVVAAREAAAASDAKYAALSEELAGVQVAAAELADIITEEPSTPNVTADFEVVPPTEETVLPAEPVAVETPPAEVVTETPPAA